MSKRRLNARAMARNVLRRVRRDAAYSNLALAATLEENREVSPRDRALATEIVYGVLRHRRRLDHVLSRYAKSPLARTNEDMLDAMRVAAYQMLLLDRVPSHAAVDDAVEAVRTLRGLKPAGFVNAVLRRIRADDLDRDLSDEPRARLAVQYSLSDELVDLFVEQLGMAEAAALAESLLTRAPLVLRVNTQRTTAEDLEVLLQTDGASCERSRWGLAALRVQGLSSPFESDSCRKGLWTVQDEAAQLVTLLVDPQSGESILDACAGVGGKALHLAEKMSNGQRLESPLCADSNGQKLAILDEHARRLGLRCETMVADLTCPGALEGRTFDKVLVDAPCSGLGVLRRHPELKWRWRQRDIGALVKLQRRLLSIAVRALRPAGVLVYSVCTVTQQEGPEQLRWLLDSYPQLELEAAERFLPPDLIKDGAMQTWPHRHDIDGFYAARMSVKVS